MNKVHIELNVITGKYNNFKLKYLTFFFTVVRRHSRHNLNHKEGSFKSETYK